MDYVSTGGPFSHWTVKEEPSGGEGHGGRKFGTFPLSGIASRGVVGRVARRCLRICTAFVGALKLIQGTGWRRNGGDSEKNASDCNLRTTGDEWDVSESRRK